MKKLLFISLLTFSLADVFGATPAVWYRLDEGALNPATNTIYSTGGTVSSVGTNGNTTGNLSWVTTGLAPVPAPGTVAALSLSGANYIRTDYQGISGNNARTITAWINPAIAQTNSNPTIVSWGPNTTGKRFDLRLVGSSSPNQIRLEITGAAVNGTANVADGNWHHVAVTFPAGGTLGSIQLYVDGSLDTTTVVTGSSSAAVNTTATNVLIGYDLTGNSRYFTGLIDDVRIYSSSLALSDIQQIALAPGITNILGNQVISYGNNAVLNAGVGELVARNTLIYQWYDNNTNAIASGTNATLTLTNPVVTASGSYSVIATNIYGSVTNSGTLTVQQLSLAVIQLLGQNPLVITQGSPFADPGAVATNVYGNATLVTTNGSVDDGTPGSYTITYSADDGQGNILSTNRTVIVQSLLPVLSSALTNETVECGGSALFSVSAGGVQPLNYQWSINGGTVANATNATFTLYGASESSGSNDLISVVVANVNGSLTNSATLTVQDTTPPVITILGANPLTLATGSAFTDPGATAYDACAGAVSVTTTFAVNTNVPGAYTIIYTASDSSGNTSSTNRTVYVKNSAVGASPNIIFVLADDLGYGDVGVFYQNSRSNNLPKMITPQLDKLAAEGMIFKQHYSSSPVCAPARASLLLGQDQGNCAIRDNQFDKALPSNHTLATVLKQAGYYCGAIGKWGLAGQSSFPAVYDPSTVTGYPLQHGFDEFFGFVDHGAGHVYYHDAGHPLYQDYTNVTASYSNIYSTDLFFARAKKFVVDHELANPSQPFFLYLAPTAVHAALQVPGGPFPTGSGINGGLQWPLTPTPLTADTWIHPDYTNATTTYSNTLVQPGNWTATMKRYATIDRRLDDGVGDLVQLLNDLNIATNTLIIFSSDNGPANESDGGAYTSDPRYFDSWANMDGIKRDLWEAGVREPTIAWWPGTIASNSVSDVISAFWDWVPTFADVTGQVPPAEADGVSLLPTLTGLGTQRSRGYWYFEYYYDGTFPVDGGTFGLFTRKNVSARAQLQSIRVGDYVAVRYNITNSTDPFRLYNVVTDPHEDNDLSANPTNAAFLAQVQNIVKQVRQPNSSASRPYDSDLVPASTFTAVTNPPSQITPEVALVPFATINGITNGALDYAVYQGSWPWVPDFDALTAVSTGKMAGLLTSISAPTNNFGISYRGYLLVPADGQYTFYLTDDSGAELWLHEVHVIDDDFTHTGAEVASSILLKAGLHPIRLFYRHASGTNNLNLKYSGPGIAKQPVPLTAYFSDCAACSTSFAALDDTVSIAENTATNINVLANVLNGGSGTLSIVSVSQPKAGTAVISSGGILYTPHTNFLGKDSFTYTATDRATVSTATVNVNVAFSDGTVWFPFDQVSGLTTEDAGGDLTGVLTGFANDPAEWVPGRYNQAIQFDGVADQVVVTGYKGILGTSNRTVTAWINTTNTGAIVSWGPKVTGEKWIFRVQADNGTSGAIRVENEGGYIVGSTVVTDGNWHHVAAVFTNNYGNVTNVVFYVDGQFDPISAKAPQAVNTQAGGDLQIGNDVQGRYFTGLIDEVHIFNRALSAAEITSLYNATNQSSTAWYYRYFGTAPVNWYASDGTGSRLLEYAFGGQPGATDVAQLSLQASIVGNHLQVTFPRRVAGTSELIYTVQASPDLVDWTTLTASQVGTLPLISPAGFEQAIYQADLSVTQQSPLYLRLQVRLP